MHIDYAIRRFIINEWAPRANVGLLLIGNRDEECGPQIG